MFIFTWLHTWNLSLRISTFDVLKYVFHSSSWFHSVLSVLEYEIKFTRLCYKLWISGVQVELSWSSFFSVSGKITKTTRWNHGHTFVYRLLCTRPKAAGRTVSMCPPAHNKQRMAHWGKTAFVSYSLIMPTHRPGQTWLLGNNLLVFIKRLGEEAFPHVCQATAALTGFGGFALFQRYILMNFTSFWFKMETNYEMCLYLWNIASSGVVCLALWPPVSGALEYKTQSDLFGVYSKLPLLIPRG